MTKPKKNNMPIPEIDTGPDQRIECPTCGRKFIEEAL